MEEALYTAVHLVVDVFLIGTGEFIRWALSFGSYEPRWKLCTGERPANFTVLAEPSAYIGAGFWFAVLATAAVLMP